MSASRRHYAEEFKWRAVKLSYSSERTLTEISESLGLSAGLLVKWRRKYTPSEKNGAESGTRRKPPFKAANQ